MPVRGHRFQHLETFFGCHSGGGRKGGAVLWVHRPTHTTKNYLAPHANFGKVKNKTTDIAQPLDIVGPGVIHSFTAKTKQKQKNKERVVNEVSRE